VGTPLGRYLLLDVLGHGAMASVFRARDSQLGRDVAVKVMGMTIATRGEGAERFRREAHAVAALKHPGIVEIYDFVDATAEEPSYIVAELIEGPTLRRLLDERQARLLPEVAALIALPLAEALATAHARGIVHRDVKPDNVMIERRSDRSRVVITDFGVAHITGLETMTATGALVGSPAYMSPEQARAHEVGPGADIWALGVLLYEMATGCLPFPGKDPFSVVASIVRGTFRRPSQIAATVGPRFERIVLRCLSPNPAARYQNAGELAADLRELAGEAGLLPEQPALCRFLDDPTKFEAELRPRVADAAVAEARPGRDRARHRVCAQPCGREYLAQETVGRTNRSARGGPGPGGPGPRRNDLVGLAPALAKVRARGLSDAASAAAQAYVGGFSYGPGGPLTQPSPGRARARRSRGGCRQA
jgi:serine/threonine-protein kinase